MSFTRIISYPNANTNIDFVPAINDYIKLAIAASKVHSFIKIKVTRSCNLTHYTVTLKVPKNQFEDDVYSNNKVLLDVVPRAFTISTINSNKIEKIISVVSGPRKFSGKTAVDEDLENDNESLKDTGIYNHDEIISWANDNKLMITSSEKANGKFALCRIWNYGKDTYITFGSKNYHITILVDSLSEWLSNENNKTPENAIVYSIGLDIFKNISNIYMLMPTFSAGYTLCGEHCDGQHFVLGNNKIEWFGFFRFGNCLDTTIANNLLASAGLNTVNSRVVYKPGDPIENIDDIILNSRCVDNEGAVLYFENIKTKNIILCKTKSVRYILMRMLRQAILNRGYMGISTFIKRVNDASDYHGLNTCSAISASKALIRFVFWMLEHKIPTNVLGVIPVVSVRGKLPTGFAVWWNQYLITTDTDDLNFNSNNFGDFNSIEYNQTMDTHMNIGIRTNGDPSYLVFTQDLQGGGKSTLAANIQGPDPIGDSLNVEACQFPINLVPHKFSIDEYHPCMLLTNLDMEYVEQDMFYGHSPSCLSWIYYKVYYSNGPKTIIVSRCNANIKHYKRYIDTLSPMPTMIYFIAPERVDYLSIISSMAGIIERSKNGDKLMVGRQECSIEETLKIITNTYKDFKINEKAIRFNKFNDIPEDILLQMKNAVETNSIVNYVNDNLDMILSTRRNIDDIATDIDEIILGIHNGDYLDKVYYNNRPTYVGLCVNPDDSKRLHVNTDIAGTHYNHHSTQFFHGIGKRWKAAPFNTVPHGENVDVIVTHRVTQKDTGAIAYRIDLGSIPCGNPTPHITCFMPLGMKPSESNKFVGLTDDTVIIENIDPIVITLTSKWF